MCSFRAFRVVSALTDDELVSDAAQWGIYLGWASAFPSILTVAFFGGLADFKGRKLVVIINCIISSAGAVLAAYIVFAELNVRYLFASRILAGDSTCRGKCTGSPLPPT